MVLIGSQAIKHYFPDFPREPKDYDYIVKEVPKVQHINTEYLRNPVLEDYPLDILEPDYILTLKASHLFWDINWDKHMFDTQFLLKKGCTINRRLFFQLYEHWNNYHGKNKRSNLSMSASDFFDNAVKCEYDHDFLHTLINPQPTYIKVLKDGAEVELDEEKFNKLSHKEKCDLASEEIMVMGWERFNRLNYMSAYSRMMKKFIMGHAPMWLALFIIENYVELHKPKFNFYKLIENGIDQYNSIK